MDRARSESSNLNQAPTMTNEIAIRTLLPADSPEALILAHQEPSLDVCRRAGVQWRGEGVGLGTYTLEDCERLTTLPGTQHGDDAARVGAWQLVRAAYAECGRAAPPAPMRELRSATGPREAPQSAASQARGVTLTIKGRPAGGATRASWEGRTPEAPSMHIEDYHLTTPIPPAAWARAGLGGNPEPTLATCDVDQLAALAGIRPIPGDTPQGRAFVQRAGWCLRELTADRRTA